MWFCSNKAHSKTEICPKSSEIHRQTKNKVLVTSHCDDKVAKRVSFIEKACSYPSLRGFSSWSLRLAAFWPGMWQNIVADMAVEPVHGTVVWKTRDWQKGTGTQYTLPGPSLEELDQPPTGCITCQSYHHLGSNPSTYKLFEDI